MTEKSQSERSAGARAERRALRDAIRREQGKRGLSWQQEGLGWVMGWLGGRIDRVQKSGGIGRK